MSNTMLWLFMAALLSTDAPSSPGSGDAAATFRLTLAASNASVLVTQPVCLSLGLGVQRNVKMIPPTLNEYDGLKLYVKSGTGEEAPLEWTATRYTIVSPPPQEVNSGQEFRSLICIWWDFEKKEFRFSKPGLYRIRAEVDLLIANIKAPGIQDRMRVTSNWVPLTVRDVPPDAQEAHRQMVQLAELIRKNESGRSLWGPLDMIVKDSPRTPYARFAGWRLGRALAGEGAGDEQTWEKAKQCLELAVREPAKDKITEDSLYTLVGVYERLHIAEEAKNVAVHYLELFPDTRRADELRRRAGSRQGWTPDSAKPTLLGR